MNTLPQNIDNIINQIPYMILGVHGKNIDHQDGFALCENLRNALIENQKKDNIVISNLVREREKLKEELEKEKNKRKIKQIK